MKNKDYDGWFNWYKETIQEMISNGKGIEQIAKELNIREDGVRNFIK